MDIDAARNGKLKGILYIYYYYDYHNNL